MTVTKSEFDAFLAAYPRALDRDVAMFYEPPLVNYNDFTLGKWPDSIVASYFDSESYPKDGTPPYAWEPNEYHIQVSA